MIDDSPRRRELWNQAKAARDELEELERATGMQFEHCEPPGDSCTVAALRIEISRLCGETIGSSIETRRAVWVACGKASRHLRAGDVIAAESELIKARKAIGDES
jgi:hypothetical protein